MLFVVTCENLNSHQGLITCWNIKNVVQPEMTIYTSNNPTQSRFSTKFPRLFATGFQSGQVQIVSIDSKLTQLPPDQIDSTAHRYFRLIETPVTLIKNTAHQLCLWAREWRSYDITGWGWFISSFHINCIQIGWMKLLPDDNEVPKKNQRNVWQLLIQWDS